MRRVGSCTWTRCRRRAASHCDIGALGADLLTLSAHKIGGPKGVGALIRARDDIHFADPLIRGGGQERGLRAGTENVAGIAAFGAAAAVALAQGADEAAAMLALRNRLEAGLKAIAPQAVIFGESAARLPNTTLFALPGMKAETAVIAFDLEGVAVSSGAACSSGKVAALPCACSHGRFAGADPGRGSRQPGLGDLRARHRALSRRLEKARNCII